MRARAASAREAGRPAAEENEAGSGTLASAEAISASPYSRFRLLKNLAAISAALMMSHANAKVATADSKAAKTPHNA